MTLYDRIKEQISQEALKCHSSTQAKKLGNTGTYTQYKQDGKTYIEHIYPNGTIVTLEAGKKDSAGRITRVITATGKELHELNQEAYTLFQHQKDMLISKYGEEGYRTLCKMADLMETKDYYKWEWHEDTISPLTGKPTAPHEPWMDERNQQRENYEFVQENMEFYQKACKDNDLRSYGDFYTVTYASTTHDIKELSKTRIITNKGNNTETCGANPDLLTSWKRPAYVITIREHDNPGNTGLYAGNMINEYRAENNSRGSRNWHDDTYTKDRDMLNSIHTVPGQKYENLIIDSERYEQSPVIIRQPYQTPRI